MNQTPKQCRSGHACDPQELKEALECLFQHSALSGVQICARAGLDYNRMAKACSRYSDRVPRFDEIIALTRNSADDPHHWNFVVVRFLLRQVNCALGHLPSAHADHPDFFGALTTATERLSAIGRELHESMRDRRLDAGELLKVKARTAAMHEQLALIDAMAEREAAAAAEAALHLVKGA